VAELPPPTLSFPGIPPDVGERLAHPPDPLPLVGDDFDWQLRDYDSFSTFMLEELAARFPDRSTWTEADLELVLLEAFAAVLDQLSDMLDRVSSEAYLETARRPESVRRLLSMIGYDAVGAAAAAGQIKSAGPLTLEKALDAYWLANPSALEAARTRWSAAPAPGRPGVVPGSSSVPASSPGRPTTSTRPGSTTARSRPTSKASTPRTGCRGWGCPCRRWRRAPRSARS
jgi:hypothetical protein